MMRTIAALLSLAVSFCVSVAALAAAPTDSAPDPERALQALPWLTPGSTGRLQDKAVFKASERFTFLDPESTDRFLRLNGNPPQGSSVTIAPTAHGQWFGILSFAAEGYVKDDEAIDADALLQSLKQANADGNARKRAQGYETVTLEGWALAPRYDRENKRLEWGTLLRDERGQPFVNVSTRILGRSGYTSAILVTSPQTLEADLKEFKLALHDFDYVGGEKYSEWRQGDKVAAYGLGALVLGGAAAAVSSKGGFKLIGLALLGVVGAVWSGVKRLLGRRMNGTA